MQCSKQNTQNPPAAYVVPSAASCVARCCRFFTHLSARSLRTFAELAMLALCILFWSISSISKLCIWLVSMASLSITWVTVAPSLKTAIAAAAAPCNFSFLIKTVFGHWDQITLWRHSLAYIVMYHLLIIRISTNYLLPLTCYNQVYFHIPPPSPIWNIFYIK